MSALRRYRRREGNEVTAVRIDLDTDGFTYRKWGGEQTAKAGDWLVSRGEEAYTVDRDVFERTYRMVRPGLYEKIAPVWARPAEADGVIATKEGETHYRAGDMIVYNDPEGVDGWAVSLDTFETLYEPDP